jgi:hypothetical protein
MRRDFKVDKLSDEFGQFDVLLTCKCGYTRRCYPQTLAKIAGWEARLSELQKRLRCSKCGQHACTARAIALVKPRGWIGH